MLFKCWIYCSKIFKWKVTMKSLLTQLRSYCEQRTKHILQDCSIAFWIEHSTRVERAHLCSALLMLCVFTVYLISSRFDVCYWIRDSNPYLYWLINRFGTMRTDKVYLSRSRIHSMCVHVWVDILLPNLIFRWIYLHYIWFCLGTG